jgi:hypothetical protein
MADPFEEFEFKPLTEGLGFHKKAEKIKNDIKTSNLGEERTNKPSIPEVPPRSILFNESAAPFDQAPRTASQSISDLIASLPPSLDFLDGKQDLSEGERAPLAIDRQSDRHIDRRRGELEPERAMDRPQIFQPLAQRETVKTQAPTPAAPIADPVIGNFLPTPGTKAGGSTVASNIQAVPAMAAPLKAKNASYGTSIEAGFERAFPRADQSTAKTSKRQTRQLTFVPAPMDFAAAILDAMVVCGLSTIMLVCILAITKINLIGMLGNAQTDLATQFHLALLFFAVLQMYMLITRSFFTATLGEWAFDLQLGTDETQKRALFPVLVAWRSIFMSMTGLVLIPALSFLFRRDLAKYVTGLQLYRRTNEPRAANNA